MLLKYSLHFNRCFLSLDYVLLQRVFTILQMVVYRNMYWDGQCALYIAVLIEEEDHRDQTHPHPDRP
jgi:hypothetical protein